MWNQTSLGLSYGSVRSCVNSTSPLTPLGLSAPSLVEGRGITITNGVGVLWEAHFQCKDDLCFSLWASVSSGKWMGWPHGPFLS